MFENDARVVPEKFEGMSLILNFSISADIHTVTEMCIIVDDNAA